MFGTIVICTLWFSFVAFFVWFRSRGFWIIAVVGAKLAILFDMFFVFTIVDSDADKCEGRLL